jgi:hypothetical protein
MVVLWLLAAGFGSWWPDSGYSGSVLVLMVGIWSFTRSSGHTVNGRILVIVGGFLWMVAKFLSMMTDTCHIWADSKGNLIVHILPFMIGFLLLAFRFLSSLVDLRDSCHWWLDTYHWWLDSCN